MSILSLDRLNSKYNSYLDSNGKRKSAALFVLAFFLPLPNFSSVLPCPFPTLIIELSNSAYVVLFFTLRELESLLRLRSATPAGAVVAGRLQRFASRSFERQVETVEPGRVHRGLEAPSGLAET